MKFHNKYGKRIFSLFLVCALVLGIANSSFGNHGTGVYASVLDSSEVAGAKGTATSIEITATPGISTTEVDMPVAMPGVTEAEGATGQAVSTESHESTVIPGSTEAGVSTGASPTTEISNTVENPGETADVTSTTETPTTQAEATTEVVSTESSTATTLPSTGPTDEYYHAMPIPSEYRGVWFAYYDFEKYYDKYAKKNNKKNFRAYFKNVIKKVKSKKLNTIIVHVRPFGDAIYKSKYFPTSAVIAGSQGKKLSYDPLKIMIEEAHKQNIRIEAWLNPYRVATNTKYSKLSSKNQAKKWHNSKKASERRNVLSYGGKLYYNPAKAQVRTLIIKGVREIVQNYEVDGIHLDDYFYPSFTPKNYKKSFDAKEYNASKEKKKGMSIVNYRRLQVDTLVKGIYNAVKEENPTVSFGISPAGVIDNLTDKYSYYVNIKKWTNSKGYVDYIAPQIYWGFYHKYVKFDKVTNRWMSMVDTNKVKLIIGLPVYRMGHKTGSTKKEKAEFKSKTLLKKMVQYERKKKCKGFILFDYEDIGKSSVTTLVNYLK